MTATAPTITITVTETIVRSYTVTPAQLDELGLPTTIDELDGDETDTVGITLQDNGSEYETDYSVTERTVEADIEPSDDEDEDATEEDEDEDAVLSDR